MAVSVADAKERKLRDVTSRTLLVVAAEEVDLGRVNWY